MTATAATRRAIPRLPRWARVALLTVHIVVSVGWVGLVGALVAMEVIGLATVDAAARAGIAVVMAAIVIWVLVPVVFLSMASGLVLALATPWGLVRHWWVLAKCGIVGVLAAIGAVLILPRLQELIAGYGEPVRLPTLIGRSVAMLMLLAATGLSVVKPWGKTPRGRRTQLAHKQRPPRSVQQK